MDYQSLYLKTVVELRKLAKEMGVPYESITKFGGDSVVNVGKTKEDREHEAN